MATIEVRADDLQVCMSRWEILGSARWFTPVIAARAGTRSVEAVEDVWQHLRGIRAPGTGFPGVIMLGTTRGHGYKDFCAAYGHGPGVVVTFKPGASEFARWVLSGEPEAVAPGLLI